MKKIDFIKQLESCGYTVKEFPESTSIIAKGGKMIGSVNENLKSTFHMIGGKEITDKVAKLVFDYARTDVAERSPDKLYKLKLNLPSLGDDCTLWLAEDRRNGKMSLTKSSSNRPYRVIFDESEINSMDTSGFIWEEVE